MKKIKDETIINYIFNENNYKKVFLKEDLNKVFEAGKELGTAGDNLNKMGTNAAKQSAIKAASGVKNFLVFNTVCTNIAKKLNENWAAKRQLLPVINSIYTKTMVVLTFFYKSNLKIIIMRGFKKFYSWDLALAAIFIYESFLEKGIDAKQASQKANFQTLKQKIEEYYSKITSKQLTINPITLQIRDSEGGETSFFNRKNREDRISGSDSSGLGSSVDKSINDFASAIKGQRDLFSGGQIKNIITKSKLSDSEKKLIESNISTFIREFGSPIKPTNSRNYIDLISEYFSINKRFFNGLSEIKDNNGNILKIGTDGLAEIPTNFNFSKIIDDEQRKKMQLFFIYNSIKDEPLKKKFNEIIKEVYIIRS